MFTVRISVPNAGPLDGTTVLDPASVVTTDPATGITLVAVPIGATFGILDPGELGSLGQQATLLLQHISVSSKGGNHAVGSIMGVVGPTEGAVIPFLPKRTLIDFGLDPTDDIESGVVTEGQCYPIPAGHRIFFDTTADGAASGPHVIQLSLLPVPALRQTCRLPIVAPP